MVAPEIAIADSNTLSCMGLQSLLEEIIPMAVIRVFSSFEELMDDTPDMYAHYFVSAQIYFEHTAFFLPRKPKTIVLANGDNQPQLAGIPTLNIYQDEKTLIRNLLQLLRLSNGDILVFACFGNFRFTFLYLVGNLDGTQFLLFFYICLSLIQRLTFSFLTQVDNIIGSITDITDIDVHQIQTEFTEFRIDVVLYFGKEFVTVGVQLFNRHIGNNQTHLAVYNIRNQILLIIY